MKKLVLMMLAMLLILTGCTKEKNITFEGQIESLSDQSMMITTKDDVGFDKASVELSSAKIEVIDVAYQKISSEEAKEIINQGEYGVILDVRTLDEYNEGHIEGATLLPHNEITEKAEITLYDKEEVILVYCRSGKRSETAAKELIDMGYTNVYDFGGIISKW